MWEGQIHSTAATPSGKDTNSDAWDWSSEHSAFTMKSSGFFPFMVLLALGILTSWALHGPLRYAIKPGACYSRVAPICSYTQISTCEFDWECPENLRCCKFFCGRKCIEPFTINNLVRKKPGKCPELKMECLMLRPFKTCEWDGQCEAEYKCCQSVCGKLCFPPQKA
ncbi:antileukoproteinase-like [Mesocricetus auratus]|uniref:Antileukoproteinase-like n=1 Tax=Mesocricetus auratus TaxID=10036 RepID=A0ABM2WDS5_MESAU|nr:antileukoproteinase-like [Mesocricetus auratus]